MRPGFKIIMGCDFAAHGLKEEVAEILIKKGYDITDAGTSGPDRGDFSDAAEVVCTGIQRGEYKRGILICGTGTGICMAANKFKGIRAALVYDTFPAVFASLENNTNVICTGAWMMASAAHCVKMIEAWLLVEYAGRDAEGMARAAMIEAE